MKIWHFTLTHVMIIWAVTQAVALIISHTYWDNSTSVQTTNFLMSGLQAIATIVGLVFFLSILVIEHSGTNYSVTMLEFFKRDYFVWFTAAYGLFTIGFIGSTIMFEWNGGLASFILFIWNLILLGIYLYHTLDMINPISMNKRVRRIISKKFNKISKMVNKRTSDKIKKDSSYQNLKPTMVKHMVIDSDNNLLGEVKKYEQFLQYIILSTNDKQEYESTNVGLCSYPQIIKQYLQLNPGHYWPDDSFFQLIRERIKEYSNDALKKDHPVFLTQIIDSSVQIGYELTEIKGMDSPMAINEPLVQLIHALTGIGKKSLSIKNWEGVGQITRALGDLGVKSVIKSGKDNQSTSQILEIGKLSLIKKDIFSCFTCINQSFKIFQKRASFPPNTMLKMDFEELQEFTSESYDLPQSEYYGNSFFFEGSEINPLEYVKNAIISCQKDLTDETEIIRRVWIIQNLKKHVSLIIDFIGKLNHWNANDIMIKVIIVYLQETQQLFQEPLTHEEEIESAMKGLTLNYEKGNLNLVELTVICLEYQYENSAIKCIEKIFLIAKNSIKNDEYGYNPNRFLQELNLIGYYLQTYPNDIILDKVIEKILEFDDEFEEHYGRQTSDELNLDMTKWTIPSWDSKYKNLGQDLKNKIMQKDNRTKFEMKVIKSKIKRLRNKIENIEK